jgi:hypothetical protein
LNDHGVVYNEDAGSDETRMMVMMIMMLMLPMMKTMMMTKEMKTAVMRIMITIVYDDANESDHQE